MEGLFVKDRWCFPFFVPLNLRLNPMFLGTQALNMNTSFISKLYYGGNMLRLYLSSGDKCCKLNKAHK